VCRLLATTDPDAWLEEHPPCAKLHWDMTVLLRSTLEDALAQLVHGADTAADEALLEQLMGAWVTRSARKG
jgi:hypothetical protein